MSELISEIDFSDDNNIEDPDFDPTTNKRKRSLIEASEPAVKKVCAYSRRIIFKDEFYTEVKKVSFKVIKLKLTMYL